MNFSLGEITEQEPQGGKVCLSEAEVCQSTETINWWNLSKLAH